MTDDTRHRPHPDYPFFLFDPEGDRMVFFRTAEARDAAAPVTISHYLDDGWAEEVEGVCSGQVTHIAGQVGREDRPKDPEEAEDEGWGSDCDYRCDYQLLTLDEARAERAARPKS